MFAVKKGGANLGARNWPKNGVGKGEGQQWASDCCVGVFLTGKWPAFSPQVTRATQIDIITRQQPRKPKL